MFEKVLIAAGAILLNPQQLRKALLAGDESGHAGAEALVLISGRSRQLMRAVVMRRIDHDAFGGPDRMRTTRGTYNATF